MSKVDATTVPSVAAQRGTLRFGLRTREALVAYLFLTPFFIFFVVFILRAVATAFQMSLFDWKILAPKRPFIGLENYTELFNDERWWISIGNTIRFTLMTVPGTTILALLAAVAVHRPKPGGTFFRVLLYAPTLLSIGVVGTTWQWLLDSQFGIVNYALSFLGISRINWLGDANLVIPALSLTTIWWGFGFPMLIFIAGLEGIPEQLYEAARIDGASDTQLFFSLTLPLLRPTILFVTVTGLISNFQVFGQPYVMTNGGPGYASYTVIYYLYQVALTGSFRVGYGAAIAIILAVIISIFTITQFRLLGRRLEY
jgi:multiple sugar transport system permease protein